jgi:hypothetical protein
MEEAGVAVRRYAETGREGIRGFNAAFIRHIEFLVVSGQRGEAATQVVARMGRRRREPQSGSRRSSRLGRTSKSG